MALISNVCYRRYITPHLYIQVSSVIHTYIVTCTCSTTHLCTAPVNTRCMFLCYASFYRSICNNISQLVNIRERLCMPSYATDARARVCRVPRCLCQGSSPWITITCMCHNGSARQRKHRRQNGNMWLILKHTHAGNTARNVREICFFNNNGFMRGNNFSSSRFKIHNFLLYPSLFLLQKQKSHAILTNCWIYLTEY